MAERPFDPRSLPALGAPIADTHAHLDMLEDPTRALANASLAGVALIVTVVDPTEEPERTFTGVDSWIAGAQRLLDEERPGGGDAGGATGGSLRAPDVRIIVGAHPHNAKDFDPGVALAMRNLTRDPRVAGVGEIGLDYHYDYSPRDVQRRVFAEQLVLAHELALPAIVHLREAHDDGAAIMTEVGLPPAGCVLHCFTGDADLLARFLDLGCFVSFAGPVTFRKADAIREAAANVPLERLLVETDCPYMAPEPYRGRKNEPALTVLTAARIAESRDVTPGELARTTWDSSVRLFARGASLA